MNVFLYALIHVCEGVHTHTHTHNMIMHLCSTHIHIHLLVCTHACTCIMFTVISQETTVEVIVSLCNLSLRCEFALLLVPSPWFVPKQTQHGFNHSSA